MRTLLLALGLVLAWSASAQVTLRGRVLDADLGDPVFSANVVVKGTTTGVTTDFDGQFLIQVPSLPTTLQVSFIGYMTQELVVNEPSNRLEIKLPSDQILIDAAVNHFEFAPRRRWLWALGLLCGFISIARSQNTSEF